MIANYRKPFDLASISDRTSERIAHAITIIGSGQIRLAPVRIILPNLNQLIIFIMNLI